MVTKCTMTDYDMGNRDYTMIKTYYLEFLQNQHCILNNHITFKKNYNFFFLYISMKFLNAV